MTDFTQLGLAAALVEAVAAEGYKHPTPIQAQAIPSLLAGRDVMGIAATGTGKTAAFALPILHQLSCTKKRTAAKTCQALVLSPTRELAAQIVDSFKTYSRKSGVRVVLVVGGVSYRPQATALARGADIVVATPGRLLDHVEQGSVRLDTVGTLVLDEADHMLDLGFLPAVRKIVRQLPASRQSLFFSATMAPEIGRLAADLLNDPVKVSIAPSGTAAARIEQKAVLVNAAGKSQLLAQRLAAVEGERTLVFTRTKRGADRVVKNLAAVHINAAAIHGNKSQAQRNRALAGFRQGTTPVLVATDIAARGIDVDEVALVINFDLPHVPETYVHRIGRTGRAGARGEALSLVSSEDRPLLKAIEKLLGPIDTESTAGVEHHPQADSGRAAGQPHGPRKPARKRFRGKQQAARRMPASGDRPTGPRNRKPSRRRAAT